MKKIIGAGVVLAIAVSGCHSIDTKEPGASQSTQSQVESAEEVAAKKELDLKNNMSNKIQSDCLRYAREQTLDPGSLNIEQGWINGEVNSDFVAIQPFSSNNAYGVRVSGTAVCTGTNGVINKYELDMR